MARGPKLPNLGPGQRRRRLMTGIVGLAVGAVGAVILVAMDAPVGWRVLLLIPFTFGALGIVQARTAT